MSKEIFEVTIRGEDVRIFMQDYKSLCAAVMICTTLVNTHTHTHTHTHTSRQLLTGYSINSANRAKNSKIEKPTDTKNISHTKSSYTCS